jgi:c-di-GMP-binding flagellar brake protein YcgR
MEDPKGKERRRKIRIPFVYGIEFDDVEEAALVPDTPAVESNIKIALKDISADGLQVSSPKFFAEGSDVKVLLKFPRWRGVPKNIILEETNCVVQAKVCWVAKNQAEESYRLGLLFAKLEPGAREIIDRYLEDNIVSEDDEEETLP